MKKANEETLILTNLGFSQEIEEVSTAKLGSTRLLIYKKCLQKTSKLSLYRKILVMNLSRFFKMFTDVVHIACLF